MAAFTRPNLVEITHLTSNPYQPRLAIDVAGLGTLIESIRQFGFMGHLEARRDPANPGNRLQLVFGHRRVRAAEIAGVPAIPIAIVDRTDDEMRRIAFIENDTVEELPFWDQGVFLRDLKRETGWTIEEMGKQLGRSKGWIQNRLDVLRLPEESPLRAAAQQDTITMTAALAMLNLAPEEQEGLFASLQQGEINSDDLKAIRKARSKPVPMPAATGDPGTPRRWTSAEHARWVLRHLEESLRPVRRHAPLADFGALSSLETRRLAALRAEVLALLDPTATS